MDVNGLVRLIFLEKSDITLGVLIGLTLLSVLLMLIRSVMEEKQEAVGSGSAKIDTKSINTAVEGAIKKALADKSVVVAGGAAAATDTGEATGDTAELKKVLSEREAKIAALMSDLDVMKGKIETATPPSGDGGKLSEGDAADLMALRTKVTELQTKLSEYEIIEDDIADLSLFKEENKKLKDEIEKLKAATETAQTQVQAAQVAVEAAAAPAPALDPVQTAQAAVTALADVMAAEEAAAKAEEPKPEEIPVAAPVAAVATAPAPEKFELDPSDEVMGEFAQALEGVKKPAAKSLESHLVVSDPLTQIADPAAAISELLGGETETEAETENDPFGPVDTDKMLEEVASLDDSKQDSESILDEALDTDRLMAEMGLGSEAPSAEAVTEPVAAAPVAAPDAAPVVAPVEAAKAPTPSSSANDLAIAEALADVTAEETPKRDIPVDDLLAEFSDPDFQPGRGVKGS